MAACENLYRNSSIHSDSRLHTISALRNEILQHVISFLPAQKAVQTCVLAKGWCHLWKYMPVLRIIADEWQDEQGVKKMNMFMKNLLLKRNGSAPVDVCEVRIGEYVDAEGDPQVDLLIRNALLRQARIIRHLTWLELTHVELRGDVLDYSSCPALKNLFMRGCYIFHSRKISSQSLEELTIIDCTFHPYHRMMPSLIKATIRLYGSKDVCGKEFGSTCSTVGCHNCGTLSNEDFNRHSILIKGLSKAESLELEAECTAFIFKRDLLWCPTFSKLKTLVLNEWCVAINSRPLICVLQHTPVPDNWDEMEGSYDPLAQPIASKKLKVVKVHYDELDGRVHNIVRIMKSHLGIEEVNGEESFQMLQLSANKC
uniref:F-box domain-containing protein n=1 Tax=Setaria viridis TaxID=4556 RepID=A0A4U6TGT5_SETVI|nr:hypothetical protein SEVIR_8G065600v2 [Setaria viridis]